MLIALIVIAVLGFSASAISTIISGRKIRDSYATIPSQFDRVCIRLDDIMTILESIEKRIFENGENKS